MYAGQPRNFVSGLRDTGRMPVFSMYVFPTVMESNCCRFLQVPAVMISGHSTIADAVQALRAGAFDFLEKPLARDKVLVVVKNAIEQANLRRENERFREIVGDGPKMIGSSAVFQHAVEQATLVARSDARVLA